MLLSDIPALAAHRAPDVTAIRFQDRTFTYVQLRDRCWRLSNAVAQVVEPGDRVAILAENCPEYTECYYGIPGAGMALTLLNYRLTARELAYIIGNSEPSVLIVEPKYLATIEQIREQIPSVSTLVLIGADAEGCVSYEDFIATGEPTARPM